MRISKKFAKNFTCRETRNVRNQISIEQHMNHQSYFLIFSFLEVCVFARLSIEEYQWKVRVLCINMILRANFCKGS